MAASGQEENQSWIFQGTITTVDPALQSELKEDFVLSGSFLLNRLELEPEPGFQDAGKGRLAGGVSRVELSVDQYYKLVFDAIQARGLAGYDYQNDDLDADGRDLMAWFFPIQGQLQSDGWSSRWLQVWLLDPSGKMLTEEPPVIGLNGLDWRNAWFRLTFEDDQGGTALVDGVIEIFGPESEELDETQWRGIAAELSEELLKRDSTIVSLREELAAAMDRNESLRKMVDLLVQERTHLQDEISILEQQAALGDPDVQQRIDELMADKSLLSLEIEELNERNVALAESLARSEKSRMELLSKIEDVPVQQPVYAELPNARSSDGEADTYTDTDTDSDPDPEPILVIDSDPEPVPDPVAEPEVEAVKEEKKVVSGKGRILSPRQRKKGPRKFR